MSYDSHGSLSGRRRSATRRAPPKEDLDPSGIHLPDLRIALSKASMLGAEPSTLLHGADGWLADRSTAEGSA